MIRKQTRTACFYVIVAAVVMAHAAAAYPQAAQRVVRAPVVINEVMASNGTTVSDSMGNFSDWIEIYNPSVAPVDLSGMYLTDNPNEPTRWAIPAGVILGPKAYLLIWADDEASTADLHVNFKLDAAGDAVYLFDTDGATLMDALAFARQSPDVSFGRYPDAGETLRFFGFPTPGQANNEGYLGEVEPLRFSRARGLCEGPFELTITCPTEGAEIIYTFDGKAPNDDSYRFWPGRIYEGPIRIGSTVGLRAMAVKPGWKPSLIATQTYILHASEAVKALPVVSLVADAGETFYEPNGVMAIVGGSYSGTWTSSGAGSYNNVLKRGLERPVSCEWIYPDDENSFQVDCGLRVHGSDWMRPRYIRQNGYWTGDGKFSFRLYFRGQYGLSWLQYPLIPETPIQQFKSVVLRAGHNDRVNPFIKDELIRRLHRDMGNVACMGTFANLLINGDYKGYFNPTEHVKEESCQQWFGSDKPWDVITMSGVRDGNQRAWDEMLSYARTHTLSADTYYQEMTRRLDVDNFIDYLIVQLWAGNWDWPQNNWSAAAEQSEAGKWRFFIWDAEGTFERGADRLSQVRFGELNSQGSANSVLYRALKANRGFRQLFADRLYKHFYNGGALTESNVDARFMELREELRGVIGNMDTYIVDGWTPSRHAIFLGACVREGLYTFDGPTFVVDGVRQQGGNVPSDAQLVIVPPAAGVVVYYTLDGTDPGQSQTVADPTIMTLVRPETAKSVLVPMGPDVGDWTDARAYDDRGWTLSAGWPGGVGYERNSGYEDNISADVGAEMYNINGSCYIRIPFIFSSDRDALEQMILKVQYDDGFIAYLNGTEVARRNFSGTPAWNSVASASHSDLEALVFETIDVSAAIGWLRRGSNVLAIHGLNNSLTSSDFLIGAELTVAEKAFDIVPAAPSSYTGPIALTASARVKARARNGNVWSALGDVTFAVGPVAESLRISEIMYHPADTGGPDDPNTEYIELTNIGAEPLNLNLVRFTNGVDFVFSEVEVPPGQYVLVVKDPAAFEARYGPGLPVAGTYAGSLSNAGERIELQDAAGRVIESLRYRDDWYDITDGRDFSLVAKDFAATDPNAWSSRTAWRPSAAAGGSPGFDDAGEVPDLGAVVISEVLANSAGGAPDWIELHNTTGQTIDVGGWFLSDDADDLTKYEIAPGTTVDPGGYRVFYEDRHFGNAGDPGTHDSFGLSRHGETVALHSGAQGILTGYSEQVAFGASAPGVSLGRYQTSTGASDFTALREPTPEGANAYPLVGPIVISEIMYAPYRARDAEYVELLNVSDADVTLYDFTEEAAWSFDDGSPDAGIGFLLPDDPPVTLAPKQYLVLTRDRVLFETRYGVPASAEVLVWGGGQLSNAGEMIRLCKPGGIDGDGRRQWITVDAVTYSDGSHPEDFGDGVDPWPAEADGSGFSLTRTIPERYGNDPNNWHVALPSPGTLKTRPSW